MRQGDPEWSSEVFPGGATVGRAGCTLTSLCILRTHLLHQRMTPREALSLGIQLDAFVDSSGERPGNLLNVKRMAPAMGLLATEHIRARDKGMDAVEAALSVAMVSGAALLWVDHDSERLNGDDDGDHYIAAIGRDGPDIICADPATGRACTISSETLDGVSPYNKRPYRLRGVRGISMLLPHS